jgi:hypothetical protein
MPLVRIRHTQTNGRERWLESVIPADETDIMVWSIDPTDAAVFDLPDSTVVRRPKRGHGPRPPPSGAEG